AAALTSRHADPSVLAEKAAPVTEEVPHPIAAPAPIAKPLAAPAAAPPGDRAPARSAARAGAAYALLATDRAPAVRPPRQEQPAAPTRVPSQASRPPAVEAPASPPRPRPPRADSRPSVPT